MLPSSAGGQIALLRDVNGMGTLITGFCAAVTIVLLVRADEAAGSGGDALGDGTAALRDRVVRIRAHDDPRWSLLDVRLDDPADLREASGQAEFADIVQRFRRRVREALPPSADIAEGADGTRMLVLLPGSEESVGHHLRQLLERVSAIDEQDELTALRVSVSVGWANVLDGRRDFDALVSLVSDRAERARALGGDRWEPARHGADAAATTNL